MFTGLVESVAVLAGLDQMALSIKDPGAWPEEPWVEGESIAVSGCCLTLVDWSGGVLRFDLSEETLARTGLGGKSPGSLVNLERAMKVGDRLGGHIVQGHVDRVGRCVGAAKTEGGWIYRFDAGPGAEPWLLEKGSICVDGISLTMVEPRGTEFDVAVIPHTLEHTSLQQTQAGDAVNIEFDLLLKHSAHLHSLRQGRS